MFRSELGMYSIFFCCCFFHMLCFLLPFFFLIRFQCEKSTKLNLGSLLRMCLCHLLLSLVFFFLLLCSLDFLMFLQFSCITYFIINVYLLMIDISLSMISVLVITSSVALPINGFFCVKCSLHLLVLMCVRNICTIV